MNNDKLAKVQIDMIKSALGKLFTFKDDEQNKYTTYGTPITSQYKKVIRLSNCCMKNNDGTTISVVFNSFDRKSKFNNELVYNPRVVEKNRTIGEIVKTILNLSFAMGPNNM